MAESYRAAFDRVRPLINPTSTYGWRKGNYLFLFLVACGFVPGTAAGMFVGQSFLLTQLAKVEWLQPWMLPIRIAVALGIVIGFITVFGLFAIWMERKVSARIHGRLGPMEVGLFHGWLQTLADGIKLLAKEDLIPASADRVLFILAPIAAFAGVFLTYLVVPFHGEAGGIVADLSVGLFFFTAVGAVEAIGVIMAGWASNSKWALFGAMRTATQVVSYELPLGLVYLTVAVVAGSLRLSEIVAGQEGWFVHWYVFKSPFVALAFIIYMIASLAETKRAPFDLPEAESELVAGYHTEYSSMRFSIFFLAEYAAMYVVAALAAAMFLGGWYTGVAPIDSYLFGTLAGADTWWGPLIAVGAGTTVSVSKAMLIVFLQMWIRWTLPRVRLDQVMFLCLRVLLPFGMIALLGATFWEAMLPDSSFFGIFSRG